MCADAAACPPQRQTLPVSTGNVAQIFAQSYAGVPYGVAYPINQCALFVSGLWGIFVFHEIRGGAVSVFFTAGAVLTSGCIMLGMYGPQ